MLAVAQRAVGLEAVDRDQIVGLLAEPIVVPFLDRDIFHRWRRELFEPPARRLDARRDEFEPCLVGSDLDALSRLWRAARLLDALPPLPREFVIVPHAHERPARSRVLQVGIGQIAFVDGAITLGRERVVELAGDPAVRDSAYFVDDAVVAG